MDLNEYIEIYLEHTSNLLFLVGGGKIAAGDNITISNKRRALVDDCIAKKIVKDEDEFLEKVKEYLKN